MDPTVITDSRRRCLLSPPAPSRPHRSWDVGSLLLWIRGINATLVYYCGTKAVGGNGGNRVSVATVEFADLETWTRATRSHGVSDTRRSSLLHFLCRESFQVDIGFSCMIKITHLAIILHRLNLDRCWGGIQRYEHFISYEIFVRCSLKLEIKKNLMHDMRLYYSLDCNGY